MSVRRSIRGAVIVFGLVVAVSFGYGGYLTRARRAPAGDLVLPLAADGNLDGLLQSGNVYLESKSVEQGLIAYRKALALAPTSVEAQLGVARAELMAGREAEAAQEYERVLPLDRRNTTALLQLARIHSHRRETWEQSERRYKDLLLVDAGNVTAQLELGRVFAWQRKAGEAVEVFSKAGVGPLMSFQDRKDYALALVQTGRTAEGEALLHQLLARSKDSEIQLQLASIYAARRDWNAALPLYAALLREKPDDARLNLTYGLGLLSARRYTEAVPPLGRAHHLMPANTEAGLGYARAIKGTGNLKKAAQEFERVASSSSDAGIVREYADLLLEKKDYGGAGKAYKRAIALGLHDTRLLIGLAGALRGNGKHREALPYLEEAYRQAPSDRLAFELASTLRKVGKQKEALVYLARIESR